MGRANNQITYDSLPKSYQKKVILVVPESERKLYKYDTNYLTVPDNIKGIAETRKYICEDAGEIRFSMVDDDVVFYRRNAKYHGGESNMSKSKRRATKGDLNEMFKDINEKMDDKDKNYIHFGNRRNNLPPCDKRLHDNVFFNSVHHIDGKKLKNLLHIDGLWTRTKVGEDANFIFEYMIRGYQNIRYDEFTAHWGSYQDGGCALYRDAKLHNTEHRKLKKHWDKFGNFVVMRKKMMAQGQYGKNIGEIEEYSHRVRNARRYYLNIKGKEHERINA